MPATPQGLNTDDLVQATSLSMQAVVDTINVLLQEHKIVLLQGRGGQAMYRLEDPETERKYVVDVLLVTYVL